MENGTLTAKLVRQERVTFGFQEKKTRKNQANYPSRTGLLKFIFDNIPGGALEAGVLAGCWKWCTRKFNEITSPFWRKKKGLNF